MKILNLFLLLLVCGLSGAQDKELVILHTNDLHSRLNGFSPESEYTPLSVNDDNTRGGFARIATLIADERKKSPNVLVLDAGDFLMGTFFPKLEESTGFQLSLMKKMGYDAISLGNHEFDFGPGFLAKVIRKSSENGSLPLMIASNALCSVIQIPTLPVYRK
jgi:5'-nucleotidase